MKAITSVFACFLACQRITNEGVVGAFVISSSSKRCNHYHYSPMDESGYRQQKTLTSVFTAKGNHNMEELLRVSQDPKAFEEYVLNKVKKEKEEEEQKKKKENTNFNNSTENNGEKKKSGYVPIEEWDEKRSKDDLNWEEKVQFEGQQFGNQFAQNEILRKNLR